MVEKPAAGPLKILFDHIDTFNAPADLSNWKLYIIRYEVDGERVSEGRIWLPPNFDPEMIPYMLQSPRTPS